MTRYMAIGAHPDDIEIGGGATLHQLIKKGHEVVCVDLTDGELTPHGTRELRKQETAAANEVLGFTTRICLDLPNRVLMDNEDARRKLATIMRQYRPEVIFTHVAKDTHPDHLAAASITKGAVLLSRIVKIDLEHEPWRPGRVYHYLCSHMRHAFSPDLINIVPEESFQAKLDAIQKYESQFVTNKANNMVVDMLTTRMKYFGYMGRGKYGEGFVCEEPISTRDITQILG